MKHFVNKERNTKVCARCLIEKPLDDYFTCRIKGRVYPTSRCKLCTAETRPILIDTWSNMKSRCYNKNSDYYYCYGGRGISICKEWLDSFKSFQKWAFNNGWKRGLVIDRIINDGNYEPKNCRWVTAKQNARNMSTNKLVTYKGKTKTIKEWSEITGIPAPTMYSRYSFGWPPEAILSKKHIRNGQKKAYPKPV